MAGVRCHDDVLMSGSRCQLLTRMMSHVPVSPQSSHQASPQLRWSQASAQISTSSRMRLARPLIGRGPPSQPLDWLSQTIPSPVRHTATPSLLYTITSSCSLIAFFQKTFLFCPEQKCFSFQLTTCHQIAESISMKVQIFFSVKSCNLVLQYSREKQTCIFKGCCSGWDMGWW